MATRTTISIKITEVTETESPEPKPPAYRSAAPQPIKTREMEDTASFTVRDTNTNDAIRKAIRRLEACMNDEDE